MPWVAYVGPFSFPDGGAAARRILGNAQSLVAAGYRVAIASGQTRSSHDGLEYRPGIRVHSLGERNVEHWPRPLRRMRYAGMGRGACSWLDEQPRKPAAVILYSGYTPYLLRLTSWCRRRGVPLIFEAVEWYEPSSALAGLLSPYQWNIELAMRWLIKRADGVIAISDFLADYYRGAGRPVVSVPPTLDVTEIPSPVRERPNRTLQLCYTGTPGRNKDLLEPVIEAVLQLDQDGERLLMHIAGIDEAEVLRLQPLKARGLRSLPQCMRAHGSLPHRGALELLQACDFSVLLRSNNRVAKAGFSTKFVESMAVGTPVIGNVTGDLARYLLEGQTGLVCADWSPAEVRRALERALALEDIDLCGMSERCRMLAAEEFDYRVHTATLSTFVEALARNSMEA